MTMRRRSELASPLATWRETSWRRIAASMQLGRARAEPTGALWSIPFVGAASAPRYPRRVALVPRTYAAVETAKARGARLVRIGSAVLATSGRLPARPHACVSAPACELHARPRSATSVRSRTDERPRASMLNVIDHVR